jgi:hypothetical protein
MNKNEMTSAVIGILFFGSVWGGVEVSFGGWLYSHSIPFSSIYLTTIAIVILASAKRIYPFLCTGTVMGAVALCFKTVNTPFFACHLLAILLLGVGYDIAHESLTRMYKGRFRLSLTGILGAYTGRILFAVLMMYVIRYRYWTEAGPSKVIDYIAVSGTVSALLGALAAPAGAIFADRLTGLSWPGLHRHLTAAVVLMTTAGIWLVQLAK